MAVIVFKNCRINIVTGLKTTYERTRKLISSCFALFRIGVTQRALQGTLGGEAIPLTVQLDTFPSLQASVVSWIGRGFIQDTLGLVVSAKATFFFSLLASQVDQRGGGLHAGVKETIC